MNTIWEPIIEKAYRNLFLRKKIKALDWAEVEKGEVIPDSAAPKSDFHLFVKNY